MTVLLQLIMGTPGCSSSAAVLDRMLLIPQQNSACIIQQPALSTSCEDVGNEDTILKKLATVI